VAQIERVDGQVERQAKGNRSARTRHTSETALAARLGIVTNEGRSGARSPRGCMCNSILESQDTSI
jgi:hypothetical protein